MIIHPNDVGDEKQYCDHIHTAIVLLHIHMIIKSRIQQYTWRKQKKRMIRKSRHKIKTQSGKASSCHTAGRTRNMKKRTDRAADIDQHETDGQKQYLT